MKIACQKEKWQQNFIKNGILVNLNIKKGWGVLN